MKLTRPGNSSNPKWLALPGGRTTVLLAVLTLATGTAGSLNAQSTVPIAIEKCVLLCEPQVTAEEQIFVSADLPEGPWLPWPEPIFNRYGKVSMAVPSVDPMRLFRLTPGHQYANDFSNETGDGWEWNNLAEDPGTISHSFDNGVLRVQDDFKAAFFFPCPEPEVIYQDFTASVDIVDWNEADLGVGFHARSTMPAGSNPGTAYGVVLATKDSSLGGPGLFIWAGFPDGSGPNLAGQLAPINPEKDYRLVFMGVGENLKAELYELPDLEAPLVCINAVNSALTQGLAGLYFVDYRDTSESIDVSVDNLLITGTRP